MSNVIPDGVNTTARIVTLLVLSIVIFNEAAAQRAVYTTNSGMTLGFGLGAAYQQSDIANSRGTGFDFFLGSQLYKKENALLSIDWKFRILGGENKAYDHRINTDGTYNNILYKFYNYDLELGLTLNRLRERTRIVLSGFAGIGMTNGIISTDLLDADGNPYDYSAIDPHIERKQIYEDLLNLSDKEFETKLINKTAVMPTLGLYLGYQFSRSFSLGIEHKINFSLTENNSSTGIDIDNKVVTGSKRDKNHYTSLGFKWILGSRASRSARRNTGTVVNTPVTTNNYNTDKPVTYTNPVISVPPPAVEIISHPGNTYSTATGSVDKGVLPAVKFIDPSAPVTVEKNIFPIRVQTMNVKAWQDVTVVVNGTNTNNFNFSPDGLVTTNIALNEGENRVTVTAKNESGTASDLTTIRFNKQVETVLPVNNIIIPDTSQFIIIEPEPEIREIPPSPLPDLIITEPAVTADEKPCGIRINPGNSSWEFCLVTPSGIIKRNALTNPDFRYSGPASSLYFLPVAGGGDAVLKGKPYTIQPGRYYLFTGNLTVTVSTKNPGSMGQWSVCIIADKEPVFGNGNNRPPSPCEEQGEERKQNKSGESRNGR